MIIQISELNYNCQQIPSQPGIYCFYNLEKDRFAYIGTSENLRERIKQHLGFVYGKAKYWGQGLLKPQLEKHPEWFSLSIKTVYLNRENYELYLIHKYKPMYNRRNIKRFQCPGFGDMPYHEWLKRKEIWDKQYEFNKIYCKYCTFETIPIPWEKNTCAGCGGSYNLLEEYF